MDAYLLYASKARGGYRHLRTSSHGGDPLGYTLAYQVAAQLLGGPALPLEAHQAWDWRDVALALGLAY